MQSITVVLEEALIPQEEEELGEIWTLVHDGASVYRADYTKDGLQENDENFLK